MLIIWSLLFGQSFEIDACMKLVTQTHHQNLEIFPAVWPVMHLFSDFWLLWGFFTFLESVGFSSGLEQSETFHWVLLKNSTVAFVHSKKKVHLAINLK